MNKKYISAIIIFLIFTSFIAYGRIINNDFINFDDNEYITENSHVKSGLNSDTVKWAMTAIVSSNWHPLTLLSHALDWSLFKEHASGHHLINLLLHIGSTLLLFLFLNRITKNLWPSAFAAALFALHPLRVESVAWAAERKDVLSMFFGMLTFYTYALYVEQRKFAKYILCLLFFALGLMAKPMLVTLPFILLLLDFWPLSRWGKDLKQANLQTAAVTREPVRKKNKKQKPIVEKIKIQTQKTVFSPLYLIWEKVPFLILMVISVILTIWAQRQGIVSLHQLPFTERASNAVISYVAYLGKIFWPTNLAVFYPYQHAWPVWQVAGALLLLVAITAFAVYFVKKAPFFLVGWLWYLGALVPVIGLVQVGRQAMADRYTYLPSIGIGIMIIWGIAYVLPQEKLRKIFLWPAA